jgi:hypothetical protein
LLLSKYKNRASEPTHITAASAVGKVSPPVVRLSRLWS